MAGSGDIRDVIVQIEDVTERNRLARELKDLADIDPLTGLFNRRRFERELAAHLARARHGGRGGAVILIDLDNFNRLRAGLPRRTPGAGAADRHRRPRAPARDLTVARYAASATRLRPARLAT